MITLQNKRHTLGGAEMSVKDLKKITLDGVEYVRADEIPTLKPNGNRVVVVVDRGWIFAGDVTEKDGRIRLDRAVWVFRWEKVGFDGVLKNPKKATLKVMSTPVDLPAGAEIFRCPVDDQWGL